MTVRDPTVVVGVDGSAGSDQAVLWAADLAARRQLTLHVVHGLRLTTPLLGVTMLANGERILHDAAWLAHRVDETITVTTDMPTEPPVPLLTDLSRMVRMIVVGHTGDGGFTGMLVGSTAAAVVSHAHCPVLVIRGRFGPAGAPEDGSVVVGVDGSPVSEQAVATAFDEASGRGVPLVAVQAWSDDTCGGMYRTNRNLADWDAIEGGEEQVLAERLAGCRRSTPMSRCAARSCVTGRDTRCWSGPRSRSSSSWAAGAAAASAACSSGPPARRSCNTHNAPCSSSGPGPASDHRARERAGPRRTLSRRDPVPRDPRMAGRSSGVEGVPGRRPRDGASGCG